MHQCRNENQKRQNAYLGRLNLGEFHLIVVILRTTISTGVDVFPPVLVVGVGGARELGVVPREDGGEGEDAGLERAEDGERGVGEGGGGGPARDEEEEGAEGPGDEEGVRRPSPRGQRGRGTPGWGRRWRDGGDGDYLFHFSGLSLSSELRFLLPTWVVRLR